MVNENKLDPLYGQGSPESNPQNIDDLNVYFDDLEAQGISPDVYQGWATQNGFDGQLAGEVLQQRYEAKREAWQKEYDEQLAELKERKQEIANAKALRKAKQERFKEFSEDPVLSERYGDEIESADNEFANAMGERAQIAGLYDIFNNPEKYTDSEIRNAASQLINLGADSGWMGRVGALYEGKESLKELVRGGEYGIGDFGLYQGDKPLVTLGGVTDATIDLVTLISNMTDNIAYDLTPEEIEYMKNTAFQMEMDARERVRFAVDKQNEINTNLGFSPNYDFKSKTDLSAIYQDVLDRTDADEYYQDVYKSISELGMPPVSALALGEEAVGTSVVSDASKAVGITLLNFLDQAAHESLYYLDAISDETMERYETRNAALRRVRAEALGLDEETANGGATAAISRAIEGKGSWGDAGKTFVLMVGDMVPEYYLASKAFKAKKPGSSGLLAKTRQGAYLTSLGLKSAGSYLRYLDEERDDLTEQEKRALSTVVGASEMFLANMFKAAEQNMGKLFKKPKISAKDVAEEGMEKILGDITGKTLTKEAVKIVGGEILEEVGQTLIQQQLENVYAITQGLPPKDQLNWYEIGDSIIGGGLFGLGGAAGMYRNSMAHSEIREKREELKSFMRDLESEIQALPDGESKNKKKQQLLDAQDQLYQLNAIGRGFYDRMSEEDKDTVLGLNNKLADLRDDIKGLKGKEKNEAIARFKKLYAEKTAIESNYITEQDLAELQKDRPNVDTLFDLHQDTVAERTIQKLTDRLKSQHDSAPTEEGPEIDLDAESVASINDNLREYARLRKEASREKDPKKKRRLQNKAGRARDAARKIANRVGIEAGEFRKMIDDSHRGRFRSEEGMAESVTQPEQKGPEFKRDATEYTLGQEGDAIDVGDLDARINDRIARAANRLNKAWRGLLKSTNSKFVLHNTEESFYGASEELRALGAIDLVSPDGGTSFGIMLPKADGSFEIHMNPNSDVLVQDVYEEFGHLVLIPLLRNDAKTRQTLYKELEKLANINESAKKVLEDRKRDYAGKSQAILEEEVILGFLVDYATNPANYKENKKDTRRWWEKLKDFFRKAINRGDIDANVISFEDSLLDFAKKFRQSTLGTEMGIKVREGVSPELRVDDSERQSRRETKKRFTYLENTEVFYDHTLFSYDRSGTPYPYSTTRRSVKVKDYWHFSNLYAKLTGNGELPGAMSGMYFMKDGKKHMIKKPKPRMNKDGTKKYYPVPDSVQGLAYKRRVKAAKAAKESRLELIKKKSELRDEIRELLKGIPGLPDGIDGINMRDFMPELVEGESEDSLERMQVAKANIDALVESEFEFPLTADGREMRGSEARRRYSEQFNLTGMLTEAGKAKALEAQQEGDAPIVGDESISGLKEQPTENGSRESRTLKRRSDIISNDILLDKTNLDALQDAPWMMVSYDQVGSVTLNFENLKGTKDENIEIMSGIQQVIKDFKPGNPEESLSMSFSTQKVLQKAINKIKDVTSDKLYVFVNVNGVESAHYNEQLFRGVMLNWASGEMKSRSKLVPMVEKLNTAFLKNTAQKGKPVKTTYDVIQETVKFQELSAEEKAAIGFVNGKFRLTSAKKAYALLDFYSSPEVSGFFDRKAVYDSVKPTGAKESITKTQIEDAIVDENYTQDGLIMPPGTITTVMTLDVDSIKERYVEGVPFPHQLTGLTNIQSLEEFISTRGLFGKTPMEVGRNIAVSEPVTREQAIIQEAEVYGREAAKKEIKDKIESLVNYYKVSEATDFSAANRLSQMWEELSEWAVESSSRLEEAMPKGDIIKRADFDANVSYPAIRAYLTSMNFEIGDAIGEAMYDVLSGISEQNLSDGELDAFLAANIDGLMQTGNERGFTPLGGALVYGAYNAISSIKKKRGGEALDMMDAREFVETHIMHSRRQKRNNTMSDPQSWTLGEKSNMQRMIESFQKKIVDKYQGILNLQAEVEKQRGRQADKGADFKMAEELMYGKAANDLEVLDGKVAKLTGLMKELGVSETDLSRYMYALHVKERNALIKERSGVEDGSGKSDAWADQTLQELSGQTQNLEKAAQMVRDIQDNTRKTYVRLGLHTQEDIDTWTNMFEHYVPLSGLAKDEENEITSPYPTGGKGLSVTSSMVKQAKGRKSAAENIVAQVIAQNAAAHIKGRTNEAVLALHNLVKENPNENVWKVINVADRDNPNVVGVRVDGKQKYIWFKDASYAETLRGMNMPQTNLVVSLLRKPAGWLRSSFTTLNPEFMVSNFSRDIQSAIFNAAAEAEIEGGILNGEGVISDIMKNVGPSLKSLLKGAIGKDMKPEYAAYFEDFKADGGKTGWAFAKDLATIAKELQAEGSDTTRAQELLGKVKNFGKTIEGINDAFENSIRLSSYIAARENGLSREKAAQFAKNITVNFNKHGEWGQTLNAVYLFFNASVQGTSRLFRSLLTMKPAVRPDGSKAEWYNRFNGAQKMAAGLALFNAMLTMLNQAMSDDDEDEISFYDKIPDYVKERNLIFMYDGKNYITIPMPYGFNVFANAGSASMEVASGSRDVDEAMMFLANSFVSSFSPISFGQSEDIGKYTVKAVSPTILKPLVEYGVNETYFGSPVYAEQFPFGAPKPDSEMSFRSPDSVQSMFRWLNEVTGGSQYRSGAVDINPDPYWYIFQYFVGGAGQFVTRTGETTYKIARKLTDTPELKLEYNDMPMLRKMYGAPSKYYDFQLFDERKKEIQALRKEMRDPKTRRAISEYKGVEYLYKLSSKYDKQLREIRRQKRDAKRIADFPTRTVKVQELMDRERKIVMEYNRLYNNYRGNE